MKYEPPQYNYSLFDCLVAWTLAAFTGITITIVVVALITYAQG